MDFTNTELKHIDWSKIEPVIRQGESGTATWKEIIFPGFRAALAEISPGYKSAEPCSKGHILYCIEGELTVKFEDGREFKLKQGESLIHGAGESHISLTGALSATVFVVDQNIGA